MYMNVDGGICGAISWRMFFAYVGLQDVDLNMLPRMDDGPQPAHTLSIMRPTPTREYQIALIESQGPDSRGVRLLRAGLAGLGKTYAPQPAMTKLPSTINHVEGVDTSMCTLADASTPPCGTLAIVHPAATRDYQISLIESQGPNSRAVRLLRAGLGDRANNRIA
jgi:hypothetical protein